MEGGGAATCGFANVISRQFRMSVSLISGHAQEYSGSYALLAIAREPFELCPHFKSPSPVSARELSIDLTWGASGPKPEFPAPEIGAQSRCAQGERGVKKKRINAQIATKFFPTTRIHPKSSPPHELTNPTQPNPEITTFPSSYMSSLLFRYPNL